MQLVPVPGLQQLCSEHPLRNAFHESPPNSARCELDLAGCKYLGGLLAPHVGCHIYAPPRRLGLALHHTAVNPTANVQNIVNACVGCAIITHGSYQLTTSSGRYAVSAWHELAEACARCARRRCVPGFVMYTLAWIFRRLGSASPRPAAKSYMAPAPMKVPCPAVLTFEPMFRLPDLALRSNSSLAKGSITNLLCLQFTTERFRAYYGRLLRTRSEVAYFSLAHSCHGASSGRRCCSGWYFWA